MQLAGEYIVRASAVGSGLSESTICFADAPTASHAAREGMATTWSAGPPAACAHDPLLHCAAAFHRYTIKNTDFMSLLCPTSRAVSIHFVCIFN